MFPVLAWASASEAGSTAARTASPANFQSVFMSPPSFLSPLPLHISAPRFVLSARRFSRSRRSSRATALPPRRASSRRTKVALGRTRVANPGTARERCGGAIQKTVRKIRILNSRRARTRRDRAAARRSRARTNAVIFRTNASAARRPARRRTIETSGLALRKRRRKRSPMHNHAQAAKSENAAIRAIIVDDEPLAREWLRERLRADGGIEIVAECEDGFKAVEAIGQCEPGPRAAGRSDARARRLRRALDAGELSAARRSCS